MPGVLLLLTLALFGNTLFAAHPPVLSAYSTDLSQAFIYWREFGYQQMRHGQIPLWNPHNFSGTPFVGNWQSALFYPPNAIYLFLPLVRAVNLEIALHVFLTGWFMSLWVARYRLHPLARLLAGTMAMFGGPFYLHVYAGHLAPLDAMAWAPLFLLAVDNLLDAPRRRWMLLGSISLAMQLLAGHPQTVFNTVVAGTLYAAFRLRRSPDWRKSLLGLAVSALGAIGLSAIQLFTGLAAAGEGTRQGAVSYGFAASFSFPPENLLTGLIPSVFGDMLHQIYWGRSFLWEVSVFLSIAGLTLGIYGAFRADTDRRYVLVGMVLVLVLFALGGYTPLFRWLYHWVPGFNKFRGHSKFIYPMSLFFALLAALGFDRLLKSPDGARRIGIALLVAAVLIGGFGLYLQTMTLSANDFGPLDPILARIQTLQEIHLPAQAYRDIRFADHVRQFLAQQCLLSAGTLLVLGMLYLRLPSARKLAYGIALVGIVELFVFAHCELTTFSLPATRFPAIARFLAAHPGDYRILEGAFHQNNAAVAGTYEAWGYDPYILKRYFEFMTFTQGGDPNDPTGEIPFSRPAPLLQMVRCRYILGARPDGVLLTYEYPHPLPHLFLATDWRLLPDRDRLFAAISDPAFRPAETVLLETPPVPAPTPAAVSGTARLIATSPNTLTIEADTPRPSLLVITDVYSKDWRAVALPGSAQPSYHLQPADYILRAIPLTAGKHRLRLEYAPPAFTIGKWVTLISSLIYLSLAVVYLRQKRRKK